MFDLKKFSAKIISTIIIVLRNLLWLITTPYQTMRSIAHETDYSHIYVLFALVYFYFMYGHVIRQETLHPFIISASSGISFIIFLITFFLVISFFKTMSILLKISVPLRSLAFTFAYSLLPTLLWFFFTSTLYYLIPPPRTPSVAGQIFSLVFLVVSLTLFFWRAILLYLSLRFTYKTQFFTIIFTISSFFVWFIPYSLLLYKLRFFRIPFI